MKLLYNMKKSPLTILLSDIPNKLGKATEANKMVHAMENTARGKLGGKLLILKEIRNEPIIILGNIIRTVILLFIINFLY